MAIEPTIKAVKKICDNDGYIFHCEVTTADGSTQMTQVRVPCGDGMDELTRLFADELERICLEHDMAGNVMNKALKLGDLRK